MNSDLIFIRANKDKVMFDLRSEVDDHLAPNVTLISSDNVKVKGHSLILVGCHYFKKLFNEDKAGNSHFVFHENFTGDVLEFVVKYIYTGEYSLLDVEKLPEVLRATSEEKYNIPALAEGYLLEQMDAPGGLNQGNWHIFYISGIKLSLGEGYCNRIYAFLIEKHPEFYKGAEFKGLTFDQICKIIKSPNRPFESCMTLMEASLFWTRGYKEIECEKLAELSKICANLIQVVNTSPQASSSPMLDTYVQSADSSRPASACSQSTIVLDPHCSTTSKRTRSISPQIDTNQRSKRSNIIEVYHPPKYSWGSSQLLFFGRIKANEPQYLLSYSFQSGEIKKIAKLPIENLEDTSLLVSQDRIYSIGGNVEDQTQDLVRSLAKSDLENLDKAWDEGPKLIRANRGVSTFLFRNTIYLFAGELDVKLYFYDIEKWDVDGNPGIWENNNRDMLYNRYCFGVAFLDNVIYMIGGYELDIFEKALGTGESYNIDDGTQSLLPSMNQARFDLQVVVLNERIYAIGGFNDNYEKLTSVESYKPGDPNWVQVANMNQHRAEGSAFVLDDMIYVVGGNYGKPTMERYCPQEDRWTMVDANLPEWANLSSTVLLGANNF